MKLKYLGKRRLTRDIYSFTFQSKEKIEYLPGQYIYLTLPGIRESEGRGPTRQFTLSSSPTESDLVITTRIHPNSKFKVILGNLTPDTEVEASGPHGVFYIDDKLSGKHVFIAGGLGVTAFYSMLGYLEHKQLEPEIKLLYFVSNMDDVVFVDEFKKWDKKKNFSYKIVLNRQKIDFREHSDFDFWIVGAPQFVTYMENMLLKQKIDRDKIHFEKFTGLGVL